MVGAVTVMRVLLFVLDVSMLLLHRVIKSLSSIVLHTVSLFC